MRVSVSHDYCFWAIEQGNGGSITPGVLRSFLPPIQNVRSLSLGLSYSLTDEDVFTFLGQLPYLESLDLFYYLVGLCIPCSPRTTDRLAYFSIQLATSISLQNTRSTQSAIIHRPIPTRA
jgi:hypothetical protein